MKYYISVLRLLVTATVVPTWPILVNLMKRAISDSEMSVLTRATRRNIIEDGILHSHRRENLKSYIPVRFHTSSSHRAASNYLSTPVRYSLNLGEDSHGQQAGDDISGITLCDKPT
jgi:hypothetical protein